MKLSRYVIAAAAFSLLFPYTMFARDKDSGSLYLASPCKIGTTQLDAGNYQVHWNGNANKVNVDVLQRDKTVATSKATLIELPKASSNDEVQTNDITHQIQEIEFSGKREALKLPAAMNQKTMNR